MMNDETNDLDMPVKENTNDLDMSVKENTPQKLSSLRK